MSQTTEAFSRVKIDALLKDAGWTLTDGVSVLFEHVLADGSRADYALCDRSGRPVAAVEAKRSSINPVEAQDQGRHYAELSVERGRIEVRFDGAEDGRRRFTVPDFGGAGDLMSSEGTRSSWAGAQQSGSGGSPPRGRVRRSVTSSSRSCRPSFAVAFDGRRQRGGPAPVSRVGATWADR